MILVLVYYSIIFRIAKAEDNALAEVYGEEYAEWKKTTKLVIPGIY
ncbi:MAG: hypothetical protein ACFCU1_13630 [Sumerlaeia bacterium]